MADNPEHPEQNDALPPPPPQPLVVQGVWDGFWQTVSSGLFFMLVGVAFLVVASGTIGRTHAGLTFVFVVVGIAVLLYGTGTQSIGAFDSADRLAEAKVKVKLAGGAGVLAFAVAAGITFFSSDINLAFREETRFLEVYFAAKEDHSSTLLDYLAEMSIDGTPIPVVRKGRFIVALVPYSFNELDEKSKNTSDNGSNRPPTTDADSRQDPRHKKAIEARFIRPKAGTSYLQDTVTQEFTIDLDSREYGGVAFDKYIPRLFVTLTRPQTAASQPDVTRSTSIRIDPEPLSPQ